MSRRAVLGALLAGGAGAAGVQGTGAFSGVTGDRQFSVDTADDDNALVGIAPNAPVGDSGESVTLFSVTNRFSEDLVLERIGVLSSGSLDIGQTDVQVGQRTLQPGETTGIDAELSCSSDTTDDVEISILAVTAGRSESVDLARTTTVSCETSGGGCLTDTEIEREDERVPCIDVALRGRDTDVSIDLSNVVVEGSVRVDIRGAGGSEIDIGIEDTTIRGDLVVDISGGGGAELEVELDANAIDGKIDVPGYDGDDVGNGSGADLEEEEEEEEEEED